MNAFKWANLYTRAFFGPDDGGGGSEAPAAPSGGDGGGGAGGAGGASPAPAAPPPSPEAPAPAGEAPAPQGFDWSALGSTDDLDYIALPTEPPAQPVPPKTPEVPPPPKPGEPPPAVPPAQPTAPPPPAAPQAEAAPLSAADPWRIAEAIEANRDMALAHLAQTKFALSEQDIKDLDTDVTTAVPKLLARVFLESQVSMQKFLAQAVPGMMQKYNRVTSANDSAEKKFFEAHKALDINNPQHRATTVRIATVYRQANPGIPLDQLIQEVGPMVMNAMRVNAPTAPAAGTAAPARGAAA